MITAHAAKQIVTVKVLNLKTLLFYLFIVSVSQRARTKAFGRNDIICILYTQTNMYLLPRFLEMWRTEHGDRAVINRASHSSRPSS
jgi:hypothetical protein